MQQAHAQRPQRQWYTTSVETVRALGVAVLLLVLGVVGFFGYRRWEVYHLQREAAGAIEESRGLIQRLQHGQAATGFEEEYRAAWASLQEARAGYDRAAWADALDDAKRSRTLLLSILDALKHSGRGGEAQFIAVQGGVEVRRGERGTWDEARARMVLDSGDYVKTAENGSAEVMFLDGTLYTVRPNTLLLITRLPTAEGAPGEQAIEMEYGWVNLNTTAQSGSRVTTPHAEARVAEQTEATVTYDQQSATGRFAAYSGSVEVATDKGQRQQLAGLEQVVQTEAGLSEKLPLPPAPELVQPANNAEVDLSTNDRLVLAWEPVATASRYALQVSRNRLFVDNVIDVDNRTRTRATLGVRGEGDFEWRVAALTKDGVRGPWSDPGRFRIAAVRGAGGLDKTPPEVELADVQSYGSIFIFSGRTEPGSSVAVAGEQVAVKADGSFTKTVQLEQEGWNIVEVKVRDAAGNETVRRQRVFVDSL